MGGETSDLISHSLGRDHGDLFDNLLVGIEIDGKLEVVLLNNLPGGSLDQVSSDATHFV